MGAVARVASILVDLASCIAALANLSLGFDNSVSHVWANSVIPHHGLLQQRNHLSLVSHLYHSHRVITRLVRLSFSRSSKLEHGSHDLHLLLPIPIQGECYS